MNLTLRESLLAFRRAPLLSALSVTTIAFSLFVVGLFGLVAVNLRHALSTVEERVEIVAYVLRGTPTETIAQASSDIAAFPEVASVNYVSEDEALRRARTELVEFRDAYRDLATNPLPASLEIKMKPGMRDAATVSRVADRVKGFTFVDDVRFARDWIAQLDRLRNLLGFVGLMVGAAFAVVAVVIIGTTIRMAVLQRAREISIMRLVGATDGFVRGPFLLEGAFKGLLGGLLALAMCLVTFHLVRTNSGLFSGLVFFEPWHLGVGILFGIAMGLGASLVSVGRHLKDV
ncbi:MAG TPA: permease-like cell division protein FtsX [Gemmatimonadales bacterium]|nr:permease-like cell division protein FtsX [Gemmatimonadales bacterium]